MNDPRHPPSSAHVIAAIAGRDLTLARRQRFVQWMFLASLLPPVIGLVVLLGRLFARTSTNADPGWDPTLEVLRTQIVPVALLAVGLGTPIIARERAERVLYPYAVRPLRAVDYVLGKMLSVAVPSGLLMILPIFVFVALRRGVLGAEVSLTDSGILAAKALLLALVMSLGFSGFSVGVSSLVRRARWALLLALGAMLVPDALVRLTRGLGANGVGPLSATTDLYLALFVSGNRNQGLIAALVLAGYGVFGAWLATRRVEREMEP